MRRLLVLLVLLAGCGSEERGDLSAVTTTTRPEVEVTVRLTAEPYGIGCTYAHPGGNGTQVLISDQDGARLGVGTLQLTEEGETCDWSASVPVEAGRGFYVVSAERTELATIPGDELGDEVHIEVNYWGDVRVL